MPAVLDLVGTPFDNGIPRDPCNNNERCYEPIEMIGLRLSDLSKQQDGTSSYSNKSCRMKLKSDGKIVATADNGYLTIEGTERTVTRMVANGTEIALTWENFQIMCDAFMSVQYGNSASIALGKAAGQNGHSSERAFLAKAAMAGTGSGAGPAAVPRMR
jgi:hypothetical protein